MEAVYVPTERKAGTNLRSIAAKYITNGRYNPMNSVMIAEEYKQRQEKVNERRRKQAEETAMIFSNFTDLVKNKIRY